MAQQQGGVPPVVEVTVTVPGGLPILLELSSGSVTKSLGSGYRYSAKLDVVPLPGVWEAVSTPGAVFRIIFGWQFGPRRSQHVTRQMGVYLLDESPKASRGSAIELNLVDLWKRLEDARFQSPWSSGEMVTRGDAIASLVNNSQTGLSVAIRDRVRFSWVLSPRRRSAMRSYFIGRSVTFERDRAEAITTIARDGRMVAFFDHEGTFVMMPDWADATLRPIATFTDGVNATILDLSRQVKPRRLYNAARVLPITDGDDPQTWTAVTVHVADETHPRHRSKIGVVPGFFSTPTIANRAEAIEVGRTRLRSLLQRPEAVEVQTWARPDIEPGSAFSTVETATYAREQLTGTWLVEQVEFDLIGLGTRIQGRSGAADDVEDEEV